MELVMLLFLFTPVAKYSPSHVLDIVISIQYALPNLILL